MIADDDAEIVESTTLLLEALGYEAVAVRDARVVMDTLRRERPDVLLHDVRMPGIDIEPHLEGIRADPDVGGIPIIIFSGDMEAETVRARVGADGVLEKPFDPAHLKKLLDEVTA